MQFLIETVTRPDAEAEAGRGRQLALRPTLVDVRGIAAEFVRDDAAALAELERLGRSPEGELRGDWGALRFAPAA
jgi:hypothetical protein